MRDNKTTMKAIHIFRLPPLFCLAAVAAGAAPYSWQQPHAKVTAKGDLEWAPAPFAAEKGADVRYIDFENGDDTRDGRAPATAWKHHPLDPAATAAAREGAAADTFVFKRGAIYRGVLRGRLVGTAGRPVRLTVDPAWGAGEAVIAGSERVTGWRAGADREDIPEGAKVWVADLDFAPRAVWAVAADGAITRIPLARTPNWSVSDPEDVMSEWHEWEQPQWWTGQNKVVVGGKTMHLGIDTKHLTGTAEDYVGGIVWSEWGIVMGTPFASAIEHFDPVKRGIGFQGFWYDDSGTIITGNRYFLEDKPNFLDAPGEFWFDKRGDGGRLYLRLPGDADPRGVRVEAARHITLMDVTELRHVRVSGLSFRFSNVFWDLTARGFVHPDVQSAAIRLHGSGEDIRISHCRFEHVNKAVRLKAVADTDSLDGVVISDNLVRFTDHGAMDIEGSTRWGKKNPPFACFGDLKVLRNRLHEIGRRPFRSDSAHAMNIGFPETLEVAGNILERTYGAGIFVFMGKPSDATSDVPLVRGLIHHNKVVQPLLAANDWGGIETWQGGPVYVYNNISGNPGGYWNWAANKPGNARLGFAFYLDGAFKNYHFNNIAWGACNDLNSKYCNRAAFYQAVPAVLNTFANNTAYRFAEGSGWSPAGGRQLFLGNVWDDISKSVFLHGKQKEDAEATYDHYPLETVAYSRNVFHRLGGSLGLLEGATDEATDLDGFRAAAAARKLLAADVGTLATRPVLRDPAAGDFRPAPGSAAVDGGVRIFVPWSLSRTVGEWHFRRNNADPAKAIDEHWYMSPQVVNRDTYKDLPRHDLAGVGITAANYGPGPLEDWCDGCLTLDGRGGHFRLPAPPAEENPAPPPAEDPGLLTQTPADWLEVTTPAVMAVGRPATIRVRLLQPPAGQRLVVHLHWLKKDGWGGFNELSQPFSLPVDGEGPYTFTVTPKEQEGLDAFSVLVGLTPSGEWKDVTRSATARVPAAKPEPAAPATLPGPHETDGDFLLEVFFRTVAGATGGALVRNLDQRGHELTVDAAGSLVFRVQADASAQVRTPTAVNDGRWHHVIAECDRDGGALRLYLDGRKVAEAAAALQGPCRNAADLLVGEGFAGGIEFLRICLGTLAGSKTTIEELHTWQFDGPFLRDFAGRSPAGKRRDAGAIEAADAAGGLVFRVQAGAEHDSAVLLAAE